MSKIIKPSDTKLFDSAKKFKKKPFSVNVKSARNTPVSTDLPWAVKNNPGSKLAAEKTSPEDMIAQAERKSEQIVREAETQAAQIRKRAREQGCAEGLEEARKKAEERLQAFSRIQDSLIAQLKAEESELMRLLTPRLADLATDLAQKIIHREIKMDSSIIASQAEEAISKILEREKLIIRVNPIDEDFMKGHKTTLIKMFDGIDKIEVIADAKVETGGCIVETNLIRVDTQPSSQLGAARQALQGEIEK